MSNRQQRRAQERSLASLKKRKPKNVKIDGRLLTATVTRGEKVVDFKVDLNSYDIYNNICALVDASKKKDEFLKKIILDAREKFGENSAEAYTYIISETSRYTVSLLDACFGNGVVEELLGCSNPRFEVLKELIDKDLGYLIEYAFADFEPELKALDITSVDDREDDE